jgi:hypothetical protein
MRLYLMFLLLIVACGYTTEDIYLIDSVDIKVFDNRTPWRLHEYDLTYAVEKQIMASGIEITRDSPYVLEGEIAEVSMPKQVEVGMDVVVVSSFSVKLKIKLYNRSNGQILLQDEKTESATIVWNRGENIDSAKSETFDKLAKWVVSRLEREW